MPEKSNNHACNAAEYIQTTFLHTHRKIVTPEEVRYQKSLDYVTKNQPVKTWQDIG